MAQKRKYNRRGKSELLGECVDLLAKAKESIDSNPSIAKMNIKLAEQNIQDYILKQRNYEQRTI